MSALSPRVPTPTSTAGKIALALVCLSLVACDVPNFEGPQIQTPPPAFFLQPEAYQQRRLFPDREIIHHDAWVETSDGLFSGIYINGHAGVLTEDDLIAAQESAKTLAEQPITFEPIERLTIDGRTAWGWAERLQTPERGLDWIAYRAIVPYDTITYAIEFYGGEPGLKGKPDTLKVIISSFAIGETTWNLPLIAVMVGATLLLVNVLRSRAQEKATRLQGISLKQIPKEELDRLKKESGRPAASGPGPASPSPGASPSSSPAAPPSEGSVAKDAPPATGGSIADAVRAATEKPKRPE